MKKSGTPRIFSKMRSSGQKPSFKLLSGQKLPNPFDTWRSPKVSTAGNGASVSGTARNKATALESIANRSDRHDSMWFHETAQGTADFRAGRIAQMTNEKKERDEDVLPSKINKALFSDHTDASRDKRKDPTLTQLWPVPSTITDDENSRSRILKLSPPETNWNQFDTATTAFGSNAPLVDEESQDQERLDMDVDDMQELSQILAVSQEFNWDSEPENNGDSEDDWVSIFDEAEKIVEEDSRKRKEHQSSSKFNSATKANKLNGGVRQVSMENYTTPNTKRQQLPLDTNDTKFLNGKIFKKGETFQSLGLSKGYFDKYYFTIKDHILEDLQKLAKCSEVFMDLERTFIGKEQALKLTENIEWVQQFENKDDCSKIRCKTTNRLKKGGEIALKFLNCRYIKKKPDPFLLYDEGTTEKSMSPTFKVSYEYCNPRLKNVSWCWKERELKNKPVALDLFAGCGGMGIGLQKAGFDVKYMVEKDHNAADTLDMNHQTTAEVYQECIHIFLQKVIEGDPTCPKIGDINHINGSPPCQGFSKANRNGGKNDLSNNKLSFMFVKAVEIFKPRTASFENVTGMLCVRNGNVMYLKKIIADLLAIGYQSRLFIVNASHYGDPQKRERVILFASLFESFLPEEPPKIDEKDQVTIEMALGDLEKIEPVIGSAKVVLNGTIITEHNKEYTELKAENHHLSQCVKFAPTQLRQRGVKHYKLNRELTIRERARMQSFPDDYKFCGKITNKRDQIGNAVPVNLATHLGKKLMEAHTKEICYLPI